jgi:hypothetical protein
MELTLTHVDEGLQVPAQFHRLVMELATTFLDEEEEDKNKDDDN